MWVSVELEARKISAVQIRRIHRCCQKGRIAYTITNGELDIGYGMLWNVRMQTESRPEMSFYQTGLVIHMLATYPASKLVLVHRVDTENTFSFKDSVYRIIELVFEARQNE